VSIKRLFEAYSRNGKMSFDELLRFVSEVQGERHAGLDYVQDIFHSVKHHNVFHHHGLVHLNAFYRYLFSDTNSPLPMSGQVSKFGNFLWIYFTNGFVIGYIICSWLG